MDLRSESEKHNNCNESTMLQSKEKKQNSIQRIRNAAVD